MIGNGVIARVSTWFFQRPQRFGLILLLILALGIAFHWPRLDTLVWSSDEGIHLSAAYLVDQGLKPYSQVSFSQGPLFLEMVRWPLHWWAGQGDDIMAVRLVMLAFGLLSLVATALIGRDLANDLTGWSAAALLLAMPSFFYFARAVMADGPAITLGLWATWLAIRYHQRGARWWLMGSAILLGLSLATKFLTIYAVGWIGLLIVGRIYGQRRRHNWRAILFDLLGDGLLFGALTVGTLLAIYAWYDLPALFKSVFGMRVAMRDAFGTWSANNRDEIAEFWRYHAPLLVLALYGIVRLRRQPTVLFLLGSWLLLVMVSLRIQNPLYHQHLQLLLPPLALLAGWGIASLVGQRQAMPQVTRSLVQFAGASIGILLMLWLWLFIGQSYRTDNRYMELSANGLRAGQEPIVEFLQKFTAPRDCVVTDDLNLAFISRRFPPAMLTDLSSARLATDSISDARLEQITMRAGCQVVAPLTERITEYSPDFATWSEATFLGSWQVNDEATLWFGQPLETPRYTLRLARQFGDQLVLLGADLDVVQADQALYLSLYWQSLQPLTTDYKIFVHLRDSNNTTIVNADHLPYDNLLPTTHWPIDRAIKETIKLTLPTDDALANYRLFIGVYHPVSQERLPVEDDESGENAVIIPVAWDLL